MVKEPYVIYRLNADTHNVGVGIAIKRAANAFLKNQGYEGRVSVTEKSTDRFEAYVEIFYNGKLDFNAESLMDHIQKSGRMPTNENLVPRITIEPVQRGESVVQDEKDYDNDGLYRTIEDLGRQLAESEKTVSELTSSLTSRQRVIDDNQRRIQGLEAKINSQSQRSYESPISALVEGYLSNQDYKEAFFEAALAFEHLSDEDLSVLNEFDRSAEAPLDYLSYINSRQKLNGRRSFSTREEFDEWLTLFGPESKKDKHAPYQEVSNQVNQLEKDEALLLSFEEQDVSSDLIKSLKKLRKERQKKKVELEKRLEAVSAEFDENKTNYNDLKDSEERYAFVKEFSDDSANRRESGAIFPVVVNSKSDGLEFYVLTENSSKLDSHVRSLVYGSFSDSSEVEFSESHEEDKKEQSYIRININGVSDSVKAIEDFKKRIENDDILRVIGLTPAVSVLS